MVPMMKARCLAIGAIALLTACATSLTPERGVVNAEELNPEEEGIVFGMLMPQAFDSKGKQLSGSAAPLIEYDFYYGGTENVAVQRVFAGLNDSIPGNTHQPETFFAMKLPAGEYSLFKLYRPFQGTSGFVPTDMRFKVEPNKATYIGSLQIQFRATRGILGTERHGEKIALQVVDDAPRATRIFKERNPQVTQEVITRLMKARRL